MNELELVEKRDLREELVERVDILERIKQLFLIPNTSFATIKQVAEYYEVEEERIKKIIQRHRDEVLADGMLELNGTKTREFLYDASLSPHNLKGKFEVDGLFFNNKLNTILPKRAILRIGMLLRGSTLAKEIRTQLLNIESKTTNEVKVIDITKEQQLNINLANAMMSNNLPEMLKAYSELKAFTDRHIKEIEDKVEELTLDNKCLSGEILQWADRSRINFGIRKLNTIAQIGFGKLWNELYQELKYKSHIDLKARGKQPYISHMKETEWHIILETFSALCAKYNTSPSKMLKENEVL